MDSPYKKMRTLRFSTVLLIGLMLTLVPAPIAQAATLTVNTLLDDTTNGDGL